LNRLERRQGHLLAAGAHARPTHRDLPATEHHLTAHRAGARGAALDPVRIARSTQGRPILFQHEVQHLQARPDRELEQLGPGIDQQIDQREVSGRFNSDRVSDYARLLHGGSLSVRHSPRVWSPLVYHEQRRSRRSISTAIGTSPVERLQSHLRQFPRFASVVVTKADLDVGSETADEATEAQWALSGLQVLFPEAEFSLRLHRPALKGDPDAPSLFQRGVLLTRRVGPFPVRREYLVRGDEEPLG
jgi:hypothetical protein